MATDTKSSIENLVGHADGEVLETGETVVYDYDADGQFLGWHKELKEAANG